MVLALAANGVSCIDKIYHIERGYEKIEENLWGLQIGKEFLLMKKYKLIIKTLKQDLEYKDESY